MKIQGGIYKGLRIKTLKGNNLRPATIQIKKALFSILGNEVIGCNFLDLFAGCGNIGIEALSRGADYVAFVEKHKPAVRLIKKNLELLSLNQKTDIIGYDIKIALNILNKRDKKFDIVFIDPPYKNLSLYTTTLNKLQNIDILSKNAIIIVRHHIKYRLQENFENLICFRKQKYGESELVFYKIKNHEKSNLSG